jgi:phage/plasmid primase-like uncharacterized protein
MPEYDAQGRVIGILCRSRDGSKRAIVGSKRGLYLPNGWRELPGPVFMPEGFSDTAALIAEGVAAVGRPSCTGGVDLLAELLRGVDRDIVIVGENDAKPDGRWPGRDGAEKTARQLGQLLGREIRYTLPPDGYKDVREFVTTQRNALSASPSETCAA